MKPPDSLLLIKPGSLGDIVHTLPCAAAIREAWPDAPLTWLVDSRWEDLLVKNPCVSGTVTFPREQFRGPIGGLRAIPWALGLGRLHPGLTLDLQGLLRSALMARLSGARRVYGLSDSREGARWLYHRVTQVRPGEHAVRRYLRVLSTLGIETPREPKFPLPRGLRPEGFPEGAPFILLHPFARGKGKALKSDLIQEFCRTCAPHPVVLAGQGILEGEPPGNVHNYLNKTSLAGFLWMARAAAFVVSTDSGPMHMAAAVTSNLLSIHTWSDPRLVGPFNEKAWIWQGGVIRPQSLSRDVSLPPSQYPNRESMESIAKWICRRMEKA